MLKVNQLSFGPSTEERTRDGKFSIRINIQLHKMTLD